MGKRAFARARAVGITVKAAAVCKSPRRSNKVFLKYTDFGGSGSHGSAQENQVTDGMQLLSNSRPPTNITLDGHLLWLRQRSKRAWYGEPAGPEEKTPRNFILSTGFKVVEKVGGDVMRKRLMATFALIAYTAILIRLVAFKATPLLQTKHLRIKFSDHGTRHANFVPFKTIWPYLHGHPNWLIAIVNLAGNLAPFLPIGFLVPLVYRKMTWQKSIVVGVAVGLALEGLEEVFRVGIFDIDDVILNALGVVIGYWLFTLRRPKSI
jgi:glycopeptide antibiotics resistance protein